MVVKGVTHKTFNEMFLNFKCTWVWKSVSVFDHIHSGTIIPGAHCHHNPGKESETSEKHKFLLVIRLYLKA